MQKREARKAGPPRVDLHGAFIRHTDLSNAILRDADLSNADLTGAKLRNSDFERTRLDGAILNGADLTGARNLTVAQLASAFTDEHTVLPGYIDRAQLREAVATSDRMPASSS